MEATTLRTALLTITGIGAARAGSVVCEPALLPAYAPTAIMPDAWPAGPYVRSTKSAYPAPRVRCSPRASRLGA
jgi:hypothetical protein